jgi:nitrite reductase (NADH) large subunit
MTRRTRKLVVAGHGMVGHRLVEELVGHGGLDGADAWEVTVVGEEPRPAYDRVALSSAFGGAGEDQLTLVADGFFDTPGLTLLVDEIVVEVDRDGRTATTSKGRVLPYDHLVLATGSRPFVPPLPGRELPGVFTYRTLGDVEAITAWCRGKQTGVVLGGGLLGLEAANALRLLGLEVHVVEMAPRLMPVQLDDGGAAALRTRIEELGVHVHVGVTSQEIEAAEDGNVSGLRLADGTVLAADIVLISAGIRPRDDVARSCGVDLHERGGILVDAACRTSDPAISAIGECAVAAGRVWGLVAPGYQMAATVADRLTGGDATFQGADLSTKLKLLGIDVASIGESHGDGAVLDDPRSATYKKVRIDAEGRLIGAVLVGDASSFGDLVQLHRSGAVVADVLALLGVGAVPVAAGPSALVCTCNSVTTGDLVSAIEADGICDLATLKACTKAGTGCGGCVPTVKGVLERQLAAQGVAVRRGLCEHFPDRTRQDLYDICRIEGVRTFAQVLATHGTGKRGCEICKPTVASVLASLGGGYVLDGEQAALQDTNDFALANLQRNGTYSVVPRMPGGEVTPRQLIACAEVAEDYGLYVKVTGGQRLDLFGAKLDDLPAIWARLGQAGLESGHAYGKALRTVKSCVGQTWCRYGVQDSTSMAKLLELRYRGLRAPHKIKLAVSGCARECAEAQSKDVGVIATEAGWNLYVGGNGGFRPRHADLLAEGLSDAELVRSIDRFLQYYVRTGDRLERTAAWIERIEGGVDHVRRVVIDDSLGLGADLEAQMTAHVESYECEWAATLRQPHRLARFKSYVNQEVRT